MGGKMGGKKRGRTVEEFLEAQRAFAAVAEAMGDEEEFERRWQRVPKWYLTDVVMQNAAARVVFQQALPDLLATVKERAEQGDATAGRMLVEALEKTPAWQSLVGPLKKR
jgi:hypothetical protein